MTLFTRAEDEHFMQRCLELARHGVGLVSPNPMVGAVVVQAGGIVGEGCHRYQEKKHAEVWALEEAGEKARGAALYINLEPCCHSGRTAPCTDMILKSGIQRIIVAMTDPNPHVAGHGMRILHEAGLEVQTGILESEAGKLNEAFAKYIVQQVPFVTLKAGMTLDGKIAPASGKDHQITSEESWQRVHEIRHAHDAILTGIQTVLIDDPRLTDRSGLARRRPLWRVVLDRYLQTPLKCRLIQSLSEGGILIFCGEGHPSQRKKELEALGIEVVVHPSKSGAIPLRFVLQELGRRQISSLLVEGGGQTHFEFLKSGSADKVMFFIAPTILGGQTPVPVVAGAGFPSLQEAASLRFDKIERLGPDLLVEAYIRQSP
jgi:diaminohydroxyphosphoribosylaminopyrimidine deaminase/5-amino-6-(5-phosphoribosylamino)uracil reductase